MSSREQKSLAIALKRARGALSETQKQFASRIGVNQATISRWEEIGPRNGVSRQVVRQILCDIDRILPTAKKSVRQ